MNPENTCCGSAPRERLLRLLRHAASQAATQLRHSWIPATLAVIVSVCVCRFAILPVLLVPAVVAVLAYRQGYRLRITRPCQGKQ